MDATKTYRAKTGTVTESAAGGSSLNAYQIAKARTRGPLDHVGTRLRESDIARAYLQKMPPGLFERLAIIAVQAVAEHIAGKGAGHLVHCVSEAIQIGVGAARGPRTPGAGPGCEECEFTGQQLNDDDRTLVPCATCATSIMVTGDADDTGYHECGHAGGSRKAVRS